jgi:signal transduction histidine kinase
MKSRWLLTAVPALLGLLLTIALNSGNFENPIIYLKADLGTLLFFLGVMVSILIGASFAWIEWAERFQVQTSQQAAEERRRFIRRLDHELKNPLTAIRAGLANLNDSPSDAARHTALESIEAQTLRLSRLATDLRKLADLERRPLDRGPVDLGELLAEAYALVQDKPGAEQRRISLTVPQAPWPLPKISGDQDLLFLAVHNLLDNAVKYSPPGGTIELRAFEDGSSVVIEVADTGSGIPTEEAPHVWEELYRGKGARGLPGSGLGLALVRSIAEKHDGRITLRSRVGEGTVFSLRLPVGN